MKRFLLPLILFSILVGFLSAGLKLDPRDVPSPLIGKPAPPFELPQLHHPDKTFSPGQLHGQVWLLNVWASWCASCRQEHPALIEFAKNQSVPVYGLNYKDERTDGLSWLEKLGNPYTLSAFDANGRIGIDYGVYGVPETYVIDKAGIIRHKHTGPLTTRILRDDIMPLVKDLQR